METEDDFLEVFADIQDNLADYLNKVESDFNFEEVDVGKLHEDFTYPERVLPPTDKQRLEKFKNSLRSSLWEIDIVTFNYTKTIEKLIDYNGQNITLNTGLKGNYNVVLKSIEHVHGLTDDKMIIGVNDTSQILNKKFHGNEDVLNTLIKSDCYAAQKHTTQQDCMARISSANLICIFGSSMGYTDKVWWESIGNRLKNSSCMLLIFDVGEYIPQRRPQQILIQERRKKNSFLDKTNLNEDEKEAVKSRIFISINSDIFKLERAAS